MNKQVLLTTIEVDNLKCGGCANTIKNGLNSMANVGDVVVVPETSSVSFASPIGEIEGVLSKLKSMGYPQKGSIHGLEAGLATAKSYVSCAVGRLS